MSRGGFAGKVLLVDLTRTRVESVPLDMTLAEQFGGGLGLTVRLAYERISPGSDALSPENPIVLGACPPPPGYMRSRNFRPAMRSGGAVRAGCLSVVSSSMPDSIISSSRAGRSIRSI